MDRLRHVATSCGTCDCGCPEVFLDHNAPPERRVVITDDFGQRVQMSLAQFRVIVESAKEGRLDDVLQPANA
ncbi:hypothetical protein [Jiangella rhizosphaerae]|uniref:Uncharacterized protein n=1 Tax=Jiangella rhizosphaerae TaxID=2293569 RepID=A0A418KVL4_9ACTN|nr:hypothetical protein [Jiangella rhizosphaerae]RIQ32473.1 hypothetical protein DY240_05520 [Jiangella rhizosphaerae]